MPKIVPPPDPTEKEEPGAQIARWLGPVGGIFVLLLSALYEADEERGMELCPAHPLRKHFYWQTRYTDYAADMNVVLAYYNCRDDWQDDGSALKYWEAEALSRQCAAARARWPRQCAVIARSGVPIMKSSWIMESFTPSARISSSVRFG